MSYETILERKITGCLLGIKTGTKSVTDMTPLISQMKGINPHLAADYEQKYIKALQARQGK